MVVQNNKNKNNQSSFWDNRDVSLGVPVGCLLVPKHHMSIVKRTLSNEGKNNRGAWLRPHGIHPCPCRVMYYRIHLTVFGAIVMETKHSNGIPAVVRDLLEKGEIQWLPGVRLRQQQQQQQPPIDSIRPSNNTNKQVVPPSFQFCELFAGIGGFRLALESPSPSLKGQCIFSSEIDPYASSTYKLNFGSDDEAEETMVGDITTIDTNDMPHHYDLLVGGFPCQSFSTAGTQHALKDNTNTNNATKTKTPSNHLYLEICRILSATRPKAFLLENVANLYTIDGGTWHQDIQQRKPGNAYRTIVNALEKCGYVGVQSRILNGCDFGVVQYRERIFIVGFLDGGVAERFVWPSPPPPNRSDGDGDDDDDVAPKRTIRSILEPNDSAAVKAAMLTPSQYKRVEPFLSKSAGRSNRAVRLDGIARTLMSSYRSGWQKHSEFIVLPNKEDNNDNDDDDDGGTRESTSARFYTAREAARIMGFPDSYVIPGSPDPPVGKSFDAYQRFYHQIGNAVCPPVVEAVAVCMLRAMGIMES